MIKALLFDVFGTVVDWRSSVISECKKLENETNVKGNWEKLTDMWRQKYIPSMDKVRYGKRDWVILDILHKESLISILEELDIHGLSENNIEHLNKAWHRLDPWSDAVPGLQRLKERFIIGTMSNGNVALMVNMAKYAGLPWDVILGAEPARAYKPDPKTYLTGVEWLGLDTREVLMCAAHNHDLVAAAATGLKTAFIARPMEYGSSQEKDFEAEHKFDFVTNDINDLANQLGCEIVGE